MRTVTFQSILHGIARLAGLDPTTGDLTPQLAAQLTEYINAHVQRADQFEFWPERMLVEARTVVTTDGNYVPYSATGKTTIYEAKSVNTRHPYRTTRPGELAFVPSPNGLQLEPTAPATVYVWFRPAPPVFTADVWDSGSNYAVGALRYVEATGEVYVAILASTGQPPATSPTYWTKVDMPAVYALYVKLAAYADYLRADGQLEKASAVMGDVANPAPGTAMEALMSARDTAMAQQGQYDSVQVVPYHR